MSTKTIRFIDLGVSYQIPEEMAITSHGLVDRLDPPTTHHFSSRKPFRNAQISLRNVSQLGEKGLEALISEYRVPPSYAQDEKVTRELTQLDGREAGAVYSVATVSVRLQVDPDNEAPVRTRIHVVYFKHMNRTYRLDMRSHGEDDWVLDTEQIARSFRFVEREATAVLSELSLSGYTPSARGALRHAAQACQQSNSDQLTSAHLVAGIILDGTSHAAAMITRHGGADPALADIDVSDSPNPELIKLGNAMCDLLIEQAPALAPDKVRCEHLLAALLARRAGADGVEYLAGIGTDSKTLAHTMIVSLSKGEDIKMLFCTFCDARQDEVQKLIAGPGLYVCNECVKQSAASRASNPDEMGRPDAHDCHCSFCGKSADEVDRQIYSPSQFADVRAKSFICYECIKLCEEIIDEERERGSSP